METLSPEWSVTGQDHNIWSKMPLGEWHLQQLSFSLTLTPGSWEAAWPELPCSLRSPDSCKIPAALSRVRLYPVFPPPCYNITDLSTRSLLSKLPSPQHGATREGWRYLHPPSTRAGQCSVDRRHMVWGHHGASAAAPLCSLPTPLNI